MPEWGDVAGDVKNHEAAAAEQPALGSETGVPQYTSTTRLSELKSVLEEDEKQSRTWWRSWLIIQTSLTIGNTGWAVLTWDNTGQRAEHLLNAGASALGFFSLLLSPPPALRGREVLKRPENTPAEIADKESAAKRVLSTLR